MIGTFLRLGAAGLPRGRADSRLRIGMQGCGREAEDQAASTVSADSAGTSRNMPREASGRRPSGRYSGTHRQRAAIAASRFFPVASARSVISRPSAGSSAGAAARRGFWGAPSAGFAHRRWPVLRTAFRRGGSGESMAMSSPGSSPWRRIISRARSRMRIGSPMSSTKISPPCPMAPACMTSWLASGMVMK